MRIKKVWSHLRDLRYIFSTLYFNFHYLPFRQAIHLPILLYKPHLLKCKGKIELRPDDGRIRYGMVSMGFLHASIYPNSGMTWENHGGTIIFRGKCVIGNDTYMSFGPRTVVDFGHGFSNAAGLKLVSYRGIKFGQFCRLGWNCLCMDTNIHPLYDMVKKEYKPASGQIDIGDHNWFGTDCRIMHSVVTPERCIFGMGTTVTRGCVKKSYCVMGGNPVRIICENVMRNLEHNYEDNYGK